MDTHRNEPATRSEALRFFLWILLAASISLKIALLLTSQSLADGDEAVEGIMAIHVMERNVHPIYPYGVCYGAGTFVEVHLAALLFKVFGISDIVLKASGFVLWLLCMALIYAVANACYGSKAALLAAVLYGFSPQSPEWSLKVAGGHQVAILCCLLLLLARERKFPIPLFAALLPLAAFAHPITITLVAYLAVDAFVRAEGRVERIRLLIWLLSSSLVALAVLWPGNTSVWNPASSRLDPLAILAVLPSVLVTLFTPNLNSNHLPTLFYLMVSLIWLIGFTLATIRCITHDRNMVPLLASTVAVVFLVNPSLLVPRHLLMLYPLSCLIIAGVACSLPVRWQVPSLAILVLSGGLIQIAEMRSPCIYGPSPQEVGLERNHVHTMVKELQKLDIRYVYCFDPMLQWNIIFESREQIVARWCNPNDRFPEYPQRVDAAKRAGKQIPVIYELEQPGDQFPQRFTIVWHPDPAVIDRVFPSSPVTVSASPPAATDVTTGSPLAPFSRPSRTPAITPPGNCQEEAAP